MSSVNHSTSTGTSQYETSPDSSRQTYLLRPVSLQRLLALWRHGYSALALLSRSISQISAYPFRQDKKAIFLTQKRFCSIQKSTGRH